MLPSHKTSISYMEHCRIVVTDERLCFVREANAVEKIWTIPYGATACLLLGPGTSLTHKAAKFLGGEGVMVGFVGGDGSPLYFASQSEYRPTEYLQAWCEFWFDESARLAAAKALLYARCAMVRRSHVRVPGIDIEEPLAQFESGIASANSTASLLSAEGVFAKRLYGAWTLLNDAAFIRIQRGKDRCNQFLDRGNYLAYGMAATVLWVLGIPHSLPLLHGNTRRGALVFDLADVIKDGCILPAAFMGAAESDNDQANRARCMASLDRFNAMNVLFEAMKGAIDAGSRSRREQQARQGPVTPNTREVSAADRECDLGGKPFDGSAR
jgi:CRISPR-associated protein Cas1